MGLLLGTLFSWFNELTIIPQSLQVAKPSVYTSRGGENRCAKQGTGSDFTA